MCCATVLINHARQDLRGARSYKIWQGLVVQDRYSSDFLVNTFTIYTPAYSINFKIKLNSIFYYCDFSILCYLLTTDILSGRQFLVREARTRHDTTRWRAGIHLSTGLKNKQNVRLQNATHCGIIRCTLFIFVAIRNVANCVQKRTIQLV